MSGPSLRVTIAHYFDDEFYNLPAVTHEAPAETVFAALPPQHHPAVCDAADFCWMVDLLDDDGSTVLDDRHVPFDTANALLNGKAVELMAAARVSHGHGPVGRAS